MKPKMTYNSRHAVSEIVDTEEAENTLNDAERMMRHIEEGNVGDLVGPGMDRTFADEQAKMALSFIDGDAEW